MDISTLLRDDKFVTKYKGKISLLLADVPFGYFPNRTDDIVWSPEVIALVCAVGKIVTSEHGTICIRMGDRGADGWRTSLEQTGWIVERDRIALAQRPLWMKRKGWMAHKGVKVNPIHYWLLAHKSKNYYLTRPFGMLLFPLSFVVYLISEYKTDTRRYYHERGLPQVRVHVFERARGSFGLQVTDAGWHRGADSGDKHLRVPGAVFPLRRSCQACL